MKVRRRGFRFVPDSRRTGGNGLGLKPVDHTTRDYTVPITRPAPRLPGDPEDGREPVLQGIHPAAPQRTPTLLALSAIDLASTRKVCSFSPLIKPNAG